MRSLERMRRAIAMMFVRLSVRPFACLSGTSVHCDYGACLRGFNFMVG